MAKRLDESKNPYGGRTPFEVLGVGVDAGPEQLRNAMEERLEEIDYEKASTEQKLAKRKEVEDAYDAVRDAKSRLAVEFFIYDGSVGQNECRQAAQQYQSVEFDYARVLRGAEEILPTSPELDESMAQARDFRLVESVRLAEPGERFRPDPKAEALKLITFER